MNLRRFAPASILFAYGLVLLGTGCGSSSAGGSGADCTITSGPGTGGSGPAGPLLDHTAWCVRFGDEEEQRATAIAVDAQGRMFVAGWFRGVLDLGPAGSFTSSYFDVFLVALDPSGAPLWARAWPTEAEPDIAVGVDDAGDVLIAGPHEAGYDIGGGPLAYRGLLLAKLSRDGAVVWQKSYEGFSTVHALAPAPCGGLAMGGGLSEQLDLGGTTLTSAGNIDLLTAELNGDGSPRWAYGYGEAVTSQQEVLSVARKPDGELLIAGYGDPFMVGDQSVSGPMYWARLAADGTPVSVTSYSAGDKPAYMKAAATRANGALLVGSTEGPLDVGGGALPGVGVFIAEVDAAGVVRHSARFGRNGGASFSFALASAANGHAIFGGWFQGVFDFGAKSYFSDPYHGFLAELDGAGAPLRFHEITSGWARPEALAVTPAGEVVVGGSFGGKMTLDGVSLDSAGDQDIFVCKLAP